MSPLRGKLRLRDRLHALVDPDYVLQKAQVADRDKLRAELDFWERQWVARLRSGRLWDQHASGLDSETLLRAAGEWEGWAARRPWDYHALRAIESRAQVLRIAAELALSPGIFEGRVVVEVGPGLVGFLESCGARVGIAIEPLAEPFQAAGLLPEGGHVIYLPVKAEQIPLTSESVDIVVSRNNLDHVEDPVRALGEIHRILRPAGRFLLIVHLEDKPSSTEPHAFSEHAVGRLTEAFRLVWKEVVPGGGRTAAGGLFKGVFEKPVQAM